LIFENDHRNLDPKLGDFGFARNLQEEITIDEVEKMWKYR